MIELGRLRGLPRHIRSDNGPEFIAWAIRSWLGSAKVQTLYIAPGSPWENGYAESFRSRLRDELLDVEVFLSVAEAKALSLAWRLEYNHQGRRRTADDGGLLPPPEDTVANAPLSSDGERIRLS
jgi:putative transposase